MFKTARGIVASSYSLTSRPELHLTNTTKTPRALLDTPATHNVDFVINGHTHYVEQRQSLDADRTVTPDGIVTFISGTGGRTLGTGAAQQSISKMLKHGGLGVLEPKLATGSNTTACHSTGRGVPLDHTEVTCCAE